MKIACAGYRKWALRIYSTLMEIFPEHDFLIFKDRKSFNRDDLLSFDPDIVLFYGWSWKIPEEIIEKFTCIMLHPSPLPKYRGGSPIQNQIIRGETSSAVTLFVMDNGFDTGDIVGQKSISLKGSISDIFYEMYRTGVFLTRNLIKGEYDRVIQDHDDSTTFRRRTADQSEITIEEISSSSSEYLYNKIRMLGDPYPNAFIKTSDGKKLLIKNAQISEYDSNES